MGAGARWRATGSGRPNRAVPLVVFVRNGVRESVGSGVEIDVLGKFQLSSSAAGIMFTQKVQGEIDGQNE